MTLFTIKQVAQPNLITGFYYSPIFVKNALWVNKYEIWTLYSFAREPVFELEFSYKTDLKDQNGDRSAIYDQNM